jgi:hypothetical protein
LLSGLRSELTKEKFQVWVENWRGFISWQDYLGIRFLIERKTSLWVFGALVLGSCDLRQADVAGGTGVEDVAGRTDVETPDQDGIHDKRSPDETSGADANANRTLPTPEKPLGPSTVRFSKAGEGVFSVLSGSMTFRCAEDCPAIDVPTAEGGLKLSIETIDRHSRSSIDCESASDCPVPPDVDAVLVEFVNFLALRSSCDEISERIRTLHENLPNCVRTEIQTCDLKVKNLQEALLCLDGNLSCAPQAAITSLESELRACRLGSETSQLSCDQTSELIRDLCDQSVLSKCTTIQEGRCPARLEAEP